MSEEVNTGGRQISVRLLLEGSQSQTVELGEDSSELVELFQVLASRGNPDADNPERMFQLPLDGGREAFSFQSRQLVAISTRPPVLIDLTQPLPSEVQGAPSAPQITRPPCMIIDDFLGEDEHADMLAHTLQQNEGFYSGTTSTGPINARQNLALMEFGNQAHSKLLCNRLLTWLPHILQNLDLAPFPVHMVESQLTASNHGHYYRAHHDTEDGQEAMRKLTCVYYFNQQPVQFTGGELRLYDSAIVDGYRVQGDGFQEVKPVSNRMVVFVSDSFHELMPVHCPSRKFEHSRFAVTNWIWQAAETNSETRHGWGHMRCGMLRAGLEEAREAATP